MKYDPDSNHFVVDEDTLLPCRFFINESYEYPEDFLCTTNWASTTETRVIRTTFENRWSLSVIWGSMTYGSNRDHPSGGYDYATSQRVPPPPFMEEPELVEVGIITPEPYVVPEREIDFPGWTGPKTWPEHTVELWGEPLGWVTAAGLRFLARLVPRFDSHVWNKVTDGPTLIYDESDGLALGLEVGFEDGTREIRTLLNGEMVWTALMPEASDG